MATTLTPQELQKAKELKGKGYSTQEVIGYISGNRVGAPSSLSVKLKETPQAPQGNVLGRVVKDIPQDIVSLGRGVQRVGGEFVGNVSEAISPKTNISPTARAMGLVSAPISAATGLAGEAVMGAARAVSTPDFEQTVASKVQEGINEVVETDTAKAAVNWFDSLDEQTQYIIRRGISPAADLVSSVAPVGFIRGAINRVTGRPNTPEVPNVETKIQDVFQRAEQGDTSDATRIANNVLDPATRQIEVDRLATAYQDSLVGSRTKVNRLLQEQANDMTRGDIVVTQDDLLKALADEGVIPDLRDNIADFTTEIRNLDKRQNELFGAYQPILNESRATASIDDFASYTRNSIADSRNLRFELDKAENQLDNVINNLRRSLGIDETGTLTAKQIDDISREANARSKAYRDGGDTFQADVYSELGRAARSWLNDNIPEQSFRQVNDEWLRLEQLKRTAEAMQNQQVDVGILGRALTGYITTLTGATVIAGATNPFIGVAAGILTKIGSDKIAEALRSTRFSPEIREQLRQRLASDKALIEKLKETATTQENKNFFDDLSRRLPAAGQSGFRSEVGSGAPITVGGQTPTGRVQPGITERAKEGAIRVPEGEGQPLSRSAYPEIGEAELQKLKTESFRKILNDAGVSPDELQKAIAGGTIGILLALYMNEDGSMLPAFGAIIGLASSRGGKLKMLDEALKTNNMRREALMRAGKTDNSPEIKALEKQNTALAKEKARVADSLSPGMGIKDVSKNTDFQSGATPATTNLDPKNFKTAEEMSPGDKLFQNNGFEMEMVGRMNTPKGEMYAFRTKEQPDGSFELFTKDDISDLLSKQDNINASNLEQTKNTESLKSTEDASIAAQKQRDEITKQKEVLLVKFLETLVTGDKLNASKSLRRLVSKDGKMIKEFEAIEEFIKDGYIEIKELRQTRGAKKGQLVKSLVSQDGRVYPLNSKGASAYAEYILGL